MNDSFIWVLVAFVLSLGVAAPTDLFEYDDTSNNAVSQLTDYKYQSDLSSPLTGLSSHQHHRSLYATDNDNDRPKPYFTIRLIDRPLGKTSPADIHVKIFNHSPDHWYSVTFFSTGVYTGTANFLRMVDDRSGTPLLYSWIPQLAADYQVIVHELQTNDGHPPTVEGDEDRVMVVDKEGYDSRLQILREIENRPACQTVGDKRDLYTVWDGSWLGVRNSI